MTPQIRALIDALHTVDGSDQSHIDAVFRKHHSSFIGWPGK
jgi:hypothetical protein